MRERFLKTILTGSALAPPRASGDAFLLLALTKTDS
jgi:hypothetical protein